MQQRIIALAPIGIIALMVFVLWWREGSASEVDLRAGIPATLARRLPGHGLVIVDFAADWCAPCRTVEANLEQLQDERSDIAVVRIDIDQEPGLAEHFSITAIPALVLVDQGEARAWLLGVHSSQNLSDWVDRWRQDPEG
jgi:thiol-disulfide isomerase/thioredoxin